MSPMLALTLALAPTFDPFAPRHYPQTYVPAEAPHGHVYRPAYDVHPLPRLPATVYQPQPGDVILLSDTNRFYSLMFHIAFTGKPGHGGIVVRMPDGRLGLFEAGYNDTPHTRVTLLEYRINQYPGYAWLRPRLVPLTAEEDSRLTEFAMMADGTVYALRRYLAQLTPFRSRGPLRTRYLGKPVGPGHRFICGEAILESLVYAGVLDPAPVRPRATYPQDLFYDRSRNPYIDRHPPLAGGWGAPQLWTPIPGTALRGRSRPQPPSPWPGVGGAYQLDPASRGGKQAPQPVVVGYVPGEFRPIAAVEYPPQRVGFFDRPDRLFFRRR
jgi:hypothetical protein